MDIMEILDMLDWNLSAEIQCKGRALAKNEETIAPFIQPMTPEHNKNVWDNCAIIIAESEDEKLKPYLAELLEWLQDMNWPGAVCIFDRLRKYSDKKGVSNVIISCEIKAKNSSDDAWARTLSALRKNLFE